MRHRLDELAGDGRAMSDMGPGIKPLAGDPRAAAQGKSPAETVAPPRPLGFATGRTDDRDPLSFKEMCARFDVTPRTLRYYEYIELLAPEKEGRARFYGPREVARMTLILRGRRFGFSLEEIRQWLLIYEKKGTGPQMAALVELADRQLAELGASATSSTRPSPTCEALRETARRKSLTGHFGRVSADRADRLRLTPRQLF
jgi:DNA-binding transcriptional MerR regulator